MLLFKKGHSKLTKKWVNEPIQKITFFDGNLQYNSAKMIKRNFQDLSVIIPVYNEEKTIGKVLEKLIQSVRCHEVIVVDDGSTDQTVSIASDYPVKIFRHATNKGYGAALKTGIRKASGQKIVILDSDGQHNPADIPALYDALENCDMVIGERDIRTSQDRSRALGKKIIRLVGEYLVEQPLPDYNSGFRAFKRNLMMEILHLLPNGFSFSTTSTLAFLKEGYIVGTVPIQSYAREGRKSTVHFFRDGTKTLLLILRIIMLFNPLKIFVPVSMFVVLAGLGFGTYGYIAFSRFSNSAVMITLMGVIMFFIGLLADQIAMLNRRKPLV